MGAGSGKEPLTSPGNFFLGRKRCVAELFTKVLRSSFLPFPHFAAFDHDIMRVALSLNFDLAKFHQSYLHISMYPWFELQDKRTGIPRLRGALIRFVPVGPSRVSWCARMKKLTAFLRLAAAVHATVSKDQKLLDVLHRRLMFI